jgi:dipeptidase D
MSYPVDTLEPKLVWKYFDEIRKIPHGSRNEKALGEAVVSWARSKGFEAVTDSLGNVLIRIPASAGKEKAPVAVLQGHLDMVCEKNSDTKFDFEKDPIILKRDGDWITADGTTLGADNGIGVAMALAFMEMPEAVHGPLELLFTIDEETGLNGAVGLKPDFVGGRLLLNMDSEEEGVFYVGCAGGRDSHLSLPVTGSPFPARHACLAVEVKGLRGGHSGLDIIANRGNALKLLARGLKAAAAKLEIRLVSIEGGDKHNAIPREARALVAVPAGKEDAFAAVIDACLQRFRSEFASAEPGLSLSCAVAEAPAEALTGDSTMEVLDLLLAMPYGVIAMSRDLKGLVETSSNMARVRTEAGALTILSSSRSSVASALDGVIDTITAVGELAGAGVTTTKGYPGWQPNMESRLLALGRRAWEKRFGAPPSFTAIHAGLECGIIGEKYPGMDMISFGPTIQNPHSPDERVSIPTVAKVFEFTRAFLEEIAGG